MTNDSVFVDFIANMGEEWNTMKANAEDGMKQVQASGCSVFFLTSSILSMYNGDRNRLDSRKNANDDEQFQLELQRQKEQYEDKKTAEEMAFKLWMRQKQREFAKIELSKRIDNEFMKSDLQMFFKDWPLQKSILAINDERKKNDPTKYIPLYVIIGKHFIGEARDLLAKLYPQIVDELKVELKTLKIVEKNIYRFIDNNTIIGGPALASVFAMMSDLPTVVIMPKIDERAKKLLISIGCWNQDSLFPMQKKVFELDYDNLRMTNDRSYFQSKKQEILLSYATIVAVLNDTYSLLEKHDVPVFPSYAKENAFYLSHPKLVDFAKTEYLSLIDFNKSLLGSTFDGIVAVDVNNPEWEVISKIAREALNCLK